jgi:hypothetical protein
MSKQAASTKEERKLFKLVNVRLSYPNLFKPRAMKSDSGEEKEPEYSASFILDKEEHAKIIKAIEAEAVNIAVKKWGKKPAKFRGPIRDGATFEDDDGNPKAGYGEDVVAINAKSRSKQQCVRRNPAEQATEEDLYGGCYVNAVISLFPWQHKANGYGVSANLGAVQFSKNGERFGGAVVDAEEVFEDLGEDDDGEEEPPKKSAKKKSKVYDPDEDM